jgi:hypothetical protein
METDRALCHISGMANNPKCLTGEVEDRGPTREEQGKGCLAGITANAIAR